MMVNKDEYIIFRYFVRQIIAKRRKVQNVKTTHKI